MNGVAIADLLTRLSVDVVALLALTWLYARRHPGRELIMVFVSFNIGLFAALTAITAGRFPAGVGFGLFGVLSIIRLRSQAFSTAQIGYFFAVLVLALLTGLNGRDSLLAAILCGAVLLAVHLADHPSLHPTVHTARLTLDRAYADGPELLAVVARRLDADVVEARLLEIDEIRDTTRVLARYRRRDGSPTGDLVPDTVPDDAADADGIGVPA